MALTNEQLVHQMYIAYYQRPADPDGLQYWVDQIETNGSWESVAAAFGAPENAEYQALYGDMSRAELVAELYQSVFGRAAAAEEIEFWRTSEHSNQNLGFAIINGAQNEDLDLINNKVKFSELLVAEVGTNAAYVALGENAKALIDAVSADTNVTADYVRAAVAEAGNDNGAPGAESITLTQRADNLTGTDGDDVFVAPVTQNETGSGQLANTFETGDVLDGGAGRDTLRVDLIDSGSVALGNLAPAISATTTNIEEVYLRAQNRQLDINPGNGSTIDAEKMVGVEQWWTDNSRSDIQIEDIRSETAATTFGMRDTDPGVSFNNYFNVKALQGDVSASSAMTLNIYEGPLGSPDAAAQLQNITVREIGFTIDGQQITLDTAGIRAAGTWAELEEALKEAMAATAGAENITLTSRGNGQFVFEDASGRPFGVKPGESLVLSVINNITVTNSLAVGREEVTGAIISNAILDGVGNGSQGGALNIGAMSGLQGIEVLNVAVDGDSHLTSIGSSNRVASNVLPENRFLEVLNLSSMGDNGDLQVGARTQTLDGRALANGLINVREVNGEDFAGSLNLGITLNNTTIARYLDDATEEVPFIYTGGAQDDLFNVQVAAAVAGDEDFALDVNMGAGNDRLVISVPVARNVTVDGGTGVNSIVVSQSHGTTALNTFEGFANFQNYEVEGTGSDHDFTSMSGVDNVVVATDAGASTQLIYLEAAQNVTISGKNQTIGNASTADQDFDTVSLTNDAGVNRVVTLDNTARLSNLNALGQRIDGVLTVENLVIDAAAPGTSATRTLEIVSAGQRNTANVVESVDAALVNTFNLTGTQDLSIAIDSAANSTAVNPALRDALIVNGAELEGVLNLELAGGIVTAINAPGKTVSLTGTANLNDVLTLTGEAKVTSATTVNGFEAVALVNVGEVDVTNFNGVALYNVVSSGIEMIGMKGNEKVAVDADVAGAPLTFKAAGEATSNVLDIAFSATAAAAVEVEAQAFRTIQLDLGQKGAVPVANDYEVTLTLLDEEGLKAGEGGFVAADVFARELVITGGGVTAAGVLDTVELIGAQTNILSSIDFSGYVGTIAALTLDTADASGVDDRNMTIELNGYGAEIDETASSENIVTYVIAQAVGGAWDAVADDYQNVVSIDGFDGAGAVALEDVSVLDVSGLGITKLADFVFDTSAADLIITDANNTFAIELVGFADTADLSNENFIFA